MKFYVIDPFDDTADYAKKYIKSSRCGQGYGEKREAFASLREAKEVAKNLEKEYGGKFVVVEKFDNF